MQRASVFFILSALLVASCDQDKPTQNTFAPERETLSEIIVNGYTYRTNPHNVAAEGGPLMIDIPWWVNERGRLVVGNSVIINGEEYVRKSLDTE